MVESRCDRLPLIVLSLSLYASKEKLGPGVSSPLPSPPATVCVCVCVGVLYKLLLSDMNAVAMYRETFENLETALEARAGAPQPADDVEAPFRHAAECPEDARHGEPHECSTH